MPGNDIKRSMLLFAHMELTTDPKEKLDFPVFKNRNEIDLLVDNLPWRLVNIEACNG